MGRVIEEHYSYSRQQLSKPICIVSPQFVCPNPIHMLSGKKLLALSDGNFGVTDVNGNLMFKLKGKLLSIHGKRMLADAAGNRILTFQKKLTSARKRWQCFKGDSTNPRDHVFSAKQVNRTHFKTSLDVFLASNRTEDVADFTIKGNWFEKRCAVYVGESTTVIAEVFDKYLLSEISKSKNKKLIKAGKMMPMLPFAPLPAVANAYNRVDKATSEFLNCPDWRINIAICDTINSKPWLAKDYIKAVRGRLQHRNPNVQLLALTLLESIMKNCSEHVHSQIGERKILQEMIKIVKKKANMRVREKILMLIDTWQEAFAGRGGKITAQYYRAYEELRRFGVEFPHRSPNTVPVVTPPVSYGHHQTGASSSIRHEPNENIVSLSTLESMKEVLDLLSEMVQAVDPKDRMAVKDEVITDLYDQCRLNQKKVWYTLASTTEEEILHQGIEFNDAVQYVIEKHEAIASGSLVSVGPPGLLTRWPRVKPAKTKEVYQKSSFVASSSIAFSSNEIQEDEPSNSAPISSRFFETQPVSQDDAGISTSKTNKNDISDPDLDLDPSLNMALVPLDPPPTTNKKTAEEDMIDLLSLALSPAMPSTSNPNQTPNKSTIAESEPRVQLTMNSYVVPWAQTQPQLDYELQPPSQPVQQQSNYISPPWPPTPGYYCNPYASNLSPLSYYNNGSGSGARSNQYIPSYRLFEDLNVLGNLKTSDTPGTSGQSMLGARK